MSAEKQVEALLALLAEEVWESGDSLHKALAKFLASVRRDTGAEALRDAASHVESSYGFISSGAAARWLRDRADLLAGEGS